MIWHRNAFSITGLLCGESTSHQLIPHTKLLIPLKMDSDADIWWLMWLNLFSFCSSPMSGGASRRHGNTLRLLAVMGGLHKGPIVPSFDGFFAVRLSMSFCKQSSCLWFQAPLRSRDVTVISNTRRAISWCPGFWNAMLPWLKINEKADWNINELADFDPWRTGPGLVWAK